MAKKFNDEQMRAIHSEYYTDRGFVRKDEATGKLLKSDLRTVREPETDEIIKENRYIFDLVELEEQDCIRFNFTRHNDCGCRFFLFDRRDLVRLRDFIENYLDE